MRIVIAPDKFKGSLTAAGAAEAIRRGFATVHPDAEFRALPIADGGEGTAESICNAMAGEWIALRVRGPLGDPVDARYAWLNEGVAVIEMSEASGLWRVSPDRRDPLRSSTYGTGELMADAMRRGARKILVGLGGSATNDGGIGMAAALGFRFLTSDGEELDPVPANLTALVRIEVPEQLALPEIVALCDVQNPLLGERGATRTYGPQKGAGERELLALETGLEHLADTVAQDLGCDFRDTPGAGAAGGIAFGLLSFCGAKLDPGFDLIARILDLEKEVAACDLVITGEGRLDAQTLEGKGPAGVAAIARKHGKKVVAFAGSVADGDRPGGIFDATFQITPSGMPLEQAMREAAILLEQSAARAARDLR